MLFGSRLIGIRGDKPDRKPVPDLDIAISLDLPDPGERQDYFTAMRELWSHELSDIVGGIDVHLLSCDAVTQPWISLSDKRYRVLWSDHRWERLRDLSG